MPKRPTKATEDVEVAEAPQPQAEFRAAIVDPRNHDIYTKTFESLTAMMDHADTVLGKGHTTIDNQVICASDISDGGFSFQLKSLNVGSGSPCIVGSAFVLSTDEEGNMASLTESVAELKLRLFFDAGVVQPQTGG